MIMRSIFTGKSRVRMVTTLAATLIMATGVLGLDTTGAAARTLPASTVTFTSGDQPIGVGSDNSCTQSNAWAALTGPIGNWAAACGIVLFDVAGFGPFTKLTIHVRNRVWLHQTYPAKGWADCFSVSDPTKIYDLSGRDQNPGDMQVSANTNPC